MMIRIAYSSGAASPRGPKVVFAVLAAAAGLVLAAIAALFAAATVVVAALVGTVLLGVAAVVARIRGHGARPAPGPMGEDGVIEARRVGGHEWVAYGWSDRDGAGR